MKAIPFSIQVFFFLFCFSVLLSPEAPAQLRNGEIENEFERAPSPDQSIRNREPGLSPRGDELDEGEIFDNREPNQDLLEQDEGILEEPGIGEQDILERDQDIFDEPGLGEDDGVFGEEEGFLEEEGRENGDVLEQEPFGQEL